MWSIWDKTSVINGIAASIVLSRNQRFTDDTVYVQSINGKTINIESKQVIADIYEIDINLSDAEFITAYENKLATLEEGLC